MPIFCQKNVNSLKDDPTDAPPPFQQMAPPKFFGFFRYLRGVCVEGVLGATKTRLFGKKNGGTPNPPVKKMGVTPKSDEIFASAAARRGSGLRRRFAPPPASAAASGGRRENFIRVRGYPQFFDWWVRGSPIFFTEKSSFRRAQHHPQTHPQPKLGNKKK